LWAFEIRRRKDATGKNVILDAERLTQGFVFMPEKFVCDIVPASKERAAMVKREWEEANELLDGKRSLTGWLLVVFKIAVYLSLSGIQLETNQHHALASPYLTAVCLRL